MNKLKKKARAKPRITEPKLELAAPTALVKLDLGCGNTPRDGFEGVDIAGDKAKHAVDLFKFPWPWEDDSVDEINCSHFIEHIPARCVEELDFARAVALPSYQRHHARHRFVGQDMMFAFFDECWRILKPGAWMHVIVPLARNNRAFQDPTHRRFIVEETFFYFAKDWRDANVPQYNVRCNFRFETQTTIPMEIGARTPEVQGEMIRTRWNVGIDLVAKLQAIK